jgi:hypothetical protein
MYCYGSAEEPKGSDGKEEGDCDAAAPLPHAAAPVGVQSAAVAGLHAEVCAAGASGTSMRQCWSARRKATTNDKNSSKVRRRED